MSVVEMRRYDDLVARVYGERRLPHGTRELVLALGWALLRDPRRHDPAATIWGRAREVLNVSSTWVWKVLAEDVPRYEYDYRADPPGCQAPMVRAKRLCGRSITDGFAEHDPVTGWMTDWGFCSRPRCREYARPIRERAKGSKERAPEPVPNAGGILPLFFEWDWVSKYGKAMQVVNHREGWEPPVYGICVDEWPLVPGQEKPQAFPKLRLVASGGELVAEDAPALVDVLRR